MPLRLTAQFDCSHFQNACTNLRNIWQKSRKLKASVNDDVVSNAFCSRTVDTSNMSLNERVTFVQSIFHNVCTKVMKQLEGSFLFFFVFVKRTSSSAIAQRPRDAQVTSIHKIAKWNF